MGELSRKTEENWATPETPKTWFGFPFALEKKKNFRKQTWKFFFFFTFDVFLKPTNRNILNRINNNKTRKSENHSRRLNHILAIPFDYLGGYWKGVEDIRCSLRCWNFLEKLESFGLPEIISFENMISSPFFIRRESLPLELIVWSCSIKSLGWSWNAKEIFDSVKSAKTI